MDVSEDLPLDRIEMDLEVGSPPGLTVANGVGPARRDQQAGLQGLAGHSLSRMEYR